MFDNHYMKEYQYVSIIVYAKLDKNKGLKRLVKTKVPYAISQRHHLLTNELILEEMVGYK